MMYHTRCAVRTAPHGVLRVDYMLLIVMAACLVEGVVAINRDMPKTGFSPHVAIMDAPDKPLGELVADTAGLHVLKHSLMKTGLMEALKDETKTFTLFAPPDDAFIFLNLLDTLDMMDDDDLTKVLRPPRETGDDDDDEDDDDKEDKPMPGSSGHMGMMSVNGAKPTTLENLLKYHVVEGIVRSSDLTDGMELTTLQGKKLLVTIDPTANTVMLNNMSTVLVPDVESKNGVMHLVSNVLHPTIRG
jgi:uncharacterized surface protein with fasciclin (FAS1) repeats